MEEIRHTVQSGNRDFHLHADDEEARSCQNEHITPHVAG